MNNWLLLETFRDKGILQVPWVSIQQNRTLLTKKLESPQSFILGNFYTLRAISLAIHQGILPILANAKAILVTPIHNDSKICYLGCLYACKNCNDPSISSRVTDDKGILKFDWVKVFWTIF